MNNKRRKKIIIVGLIILFVFVIVGAFCINTNNKNQKNIIHNIIFESSTGVLIEEQTVKHKDQVERPKDPTQQGYIFVGWMYQNEIYDFSLEVTKDLVLEAKWSKKDEKKESYVVKFNSAGGTTFPNQIVTKGEKVKKPENPKRKGYIFKGWTLDNKEYNFDKKVEKNLELLAKWEKEKNTTNSTTGTNQNNTTNKPNNQTNNTTNNTNNNNTQNNASTPTKKKYTVTFNSNGGSSVKTQTVTEGSSAKKPTDPTKEGYIFEGWTFDGKPYNFSSKVTKNIKLNALWTNNTWTIDKTTGAIIKYNGTATNVTIPYKVDGVTVTAIKANAFNNKNMKTLTFPSQVLTVEANAILKTENKNLLEVYMSNSQFKKYSSWSKIFGTTGSCTSSTDAGTFIQSRLTKNGCATCEGACAVSNLVYLKNKDGVYSISYSSGSCGGVSIYGPNNYLTTEPFSIPNFTFAGYTFNGWTGNNGTTPQKNLIIPKGSTGNKKYVANCTEHTWSIRLNYANYLNYSGSLDYSDVNYNEAPYCGSSTKYCTYKYSQTVTIPYNRVKREGYTFKGWATSTHGVVVYKEGEKISKKVPQNGGILTLYARWQKNN